MPIVLSPPFLRASLLVSSTSFSLPLATVTGASLASSAATAATAIAVITARVGACVVIFAATREIRIIKSQLGQVVLTVPLEPLKRRLSRALRTACGLTELGVERRRRLLLLLLLLSLAGLLVA